MIERFLDTITKRKWAGRLFWISVFLLLWELFCRISNVSPLLVPSPEQVCATLIQGITQGDLIWQSAYSLGIIAFSLIISAVLAVVLALFSRQSRLIYSLVDTLTALAHPLPGLALLPLSLSMSSAAITVEIRLRASLGYLISGLRIGWARGWRAFISAEMVFGAVGAKGGIGWYILTQRTFMNTAGLFAGIILVIFIGMLVEDGLFSVIEKCTLTKWGMKSV